MKKRSADMFIGFIALAAVVWGVHVSSLNGLNQTVSTQSQRAPNEIVDVEYPQASASENPSIQLTQIHTVKSKSQETPKQTSEEERAAIGEETPSDNAKREFYETSPPQVALADNSDKPEKYEFDINEDLNDRDDAYENQETEVEEKSDKKPLSWEEMSEEERLAELEYNGRLF